MEVFVKWPAYLINSSMRLIHWTQKLLKELKASPVPTPDILPAKGLGNWYANLLRFDRRKCILFTNEKTIYSFLVPNVIKEILRDFRLLFLSNLCLNLQFEGFSQEVIDRVREEYKEIALAKTKDKRVFGFINEFAFEYDFYIRRAGGTANMPLMEINKQINRTPLNASKRGFYPIDILQEMIDPNHG